MTQSRGSVYREMSTAVHSNLYHFSHEVRTDGKPTPCYAYTVGLTGPTYGPYTGVTPYTGPVDLYGPRTDNIVRTGPVSSGVRGP